PYEAARGRVLAAAKPVAALHARFPQQAAQIDEALARAGTSASKGVLYLPLVGRKSFWTAFLDPTTAAVIAYLPLDSF
ncbi:MAG TPA: pilus assembly protein, partial [Ramlibacter sp.]|nr:pilus assembly protein [Ramlibacter sp.]